MILNESLIDLFQGELCKEIFENEDTLKKDFVDFVYKILKTHFGEYKISYLVLSGGIVSYNYSETSDIDIHLKIYGVPFIKLKNIADNLKGKYFFGKHPIEITVLRTEEFEEEKAGNYLYDVIEMKWIKKPEKRLIKVKFDYIMEISKFFMSGIDDRIQEFEADLFEYNKNIEMLNNKYYLDYKNEIEERIKQLKIDIIADLESLVFAYKIIQAFRRGSYDEEDGFVDMNFTFEIGYGNVSVNEMIYKILEKTGYKDKLKKYKDLLLEYKQKFVK